MKNNSVTIGVVMCIVCCVGALCIPSLFNTSSDMSSGWNPSNVYADVITTDNNVFTEAELQSSPSMGTSITRVSTSSTRLFHHSPSAIAVSNWVQTSSSSNATNYTASSNANISKGATPSAGIYTSTGNQSCAQGGATSVISSSSLATSSLSNHSPLSANSSSATTRTTVAARGMSLVTGGVSNQPLAYAAQSSLPIQASYRGIPSMSGPMKAAPGLGGSDPFSDWLESLAGNSEVWLYEIGDKVYLDLTKLKELFDSLKNTSTGGVVIGGHEYTWNDFLAWFFANGQDGTDGYGDSNEYWRVPLSDGTILLVILAFSYVLYVFVRTCKNRETTID